MWILRGSDEDGGLMFRLVSGTSRTVGRAPVADFRLEAALVSRVHCRITAQQQTLNVEDLASTNGTFVNDRRIDNGLLANGDRLRIGRVELTVEQVHD
jgi:pSer/pThr/pTyr-binding forkhead associated (FHA) protein